MTYAPTTWTDRIVQFVRRYRDQNNNQLTFTPDEGTITNIGTPITAARMNKIEQGIVDTETLANTKVAILTRGAANGVATLDSGANVPANQLGNTISAINEDSIVWELLATKALSVDASTIEFLSIPAGYTAFRVVGLIESSSGSAESLRITFNSVSGTGYDSATLNDGVKALTSNSGYINFLGAVGEDLSILDLVISNESTQDHFVSGTANSKSAVNSLGGMWVVSDLISSIKLAASGEFNSTSRVRLFGTKSMF